MMGWISKRPIGAAQPGWRPHVSLRRILRSALCLSVVCFVDLLCAGWAGAISFRVTELSRCPIVLGQASCLGAEITIGFRIESDPGEQVFGFGLSAHGYDESVVDFTRGWAVQSIFHAVAVPGVGAFSGLWNQLVDTSSPLGVVANGPVLESALFSYGNRVLFFSGVGCCPTSQNPLDPGLDGVVGGGDAQVRLTFTVVGPGEVSILIGDDYPGDGVVHYPLNDPRRLEDLRLTIDSDGQPTITPEPGAAVMIGIGLALLAARRFPDPG